jgi:protein-tyrosine phosphatase
LPAASKSVATVTALVYSLWPMRTEVVKLDPAMPDAATIKQAAALLDAGGLVGFATETVYGIACRAVEGSLNRLNELKQRSPEKPYTLHISQKSDLGKYVPSPGIRARKLIDRTWPGPVTIVFELDALDAEKQRISLGKEIFENLYRDNCIGVRCPDSPAASILLSSTQNAVVAPSANVAGRPPAVDAEQVLAQFSGKIELLLDAGPCKYKKSSSVVKIGLSGMEVLRPGVYSEGQLQALSQVSFLFVCTGNTCRSPMAEGMFRKYLAEKLGCEVDQLEHMGYKIRSAGVIQTGGFDASPEAVTACQARGVDIAAHKSSALSGQLLAESDFVYVMTGMHRQHVSALDPEAAGRCMLLAQGRDVPDPIGQGQQVYDNCADLIEAAVSKRISELAI